MIVLKHSYPVNSLNSNSNQKLFSLGSDKSLINLPRHANAKSNNLQKIDEYKETNNDNLNESSLEHLNSNHNILKNNNTSEKEVHLSVISISEREKIQNEIFTLKLENTNNKNSLSSLKSKKSKHETSIHKGKIINL